jgi:hypothetical protein
MLRISLLHGHQQDVLAQPGSKTQGAHRPPGHCASQSASVWQIGSGEVHDPWFEQKHSVGMPTHPQPEPHTGPNWHWGQAPGWHNADWANAGVLILVSTGVDHATAAPAPIRFRAERREMALAVRSSIGAPLLGSVDARQRVRDDPATKTVFFLDSDGVTEGTRTPNPQDHNLVL